MFKKKIVTVAWNKVCCPSEFGGLDIRDIAINNESLLKKFSWDILTKDSFSMKILRARFLNDQLLPNNRGYFSSIFPGIRQLIIDLMQDARWLVCDNSRLNAWTSNWLGYVILDKLGVEESRFKHFKATIAQFRHNQSWQIPEIIHRNFPAICADIQNYVTSDEDVDKLIWSHSIDGSVTTKLLYDSNFSHLNSIPWANHIWCRFIPPRKIHSLMENFP